MAASKDSEVASVDPTKWWEGTLLCMPVAHEPQQFPRGQRLQHVGAAPRCTLLQFPTRTRFNTVLVYRVIFYSKSLSRRKFAQAALHSGFHSICGSERRCKKCPSGPSTVNLHVCVPLLCEQCLRKPLSSTLLTEQWHTFGELYYPYHFEWRCTRCQARARGPPGQHKY